MSFFDRLKEAFRAWQADKAPRLGASLAYYAIFSLAPLLVVAVGIAGLILKNATAQVAVIAQAQSLVGTSGADLVRQLLGTVSHGNGNILAIVIGGVTTLVGAVGIFGQLRDALDTIWHDQAANGIKGTILQYATSFILLLLVSGLLLLSLALSAMLGFIAHRFAQIPFLIWQLADLALSFGLTFLLFALMFRTASSRQPHWKVVWPSAVLTAALFTMGKYLLSVYLGHSGVSTAYGAAGSLAVILLWLYYSAQIFLFGAEYLQILERPAIAPPSLAKQLLLLGLIPLARRFLHRK